MLKFKTSCAVLAYLSSNLLNEVRLSLFRYFEVGLRVCDIVVKKFTSAISSPDEFLLFYTVHFVLAYSIVRRLWTSDGAKLGWVRRSKLFIDWLVTFYEPSGVQKYLCLKLIAVADSDVVFSSSDK